MSEQKVKLVAITRPVVELEYNNIFTAEEFVAYAARVSNPANQANTETAPKLLKYLMKNSHWSPFEMVSMTVEVNTTRDIARQILRHRSFSFQEFSQRYADASQLGFTKRECRFQDKKNRQNSIKPDMLEDGGQWTIASQWKDGQSFILQQVEELYNWALENGIAKEQARAILPEGMTHSRLYMAGTLRSWVHYCQLRCSNGTQKEHQEIANQAFEILKKEFPSLEIDIIQE